jgi:hypothetical protein
MTIKKVGKIKKESKEDVKSLLLHLESEYRKANISEKHYKELKEKYKKMLGESKIEKRKGVRKIPKPEEVEEVEKEPEVEEELGRVEEQAKKEISEKPPEKKGFLKSLFGKREEVKTEEVKKEPETIKKEVPHPKEVKHKEKKKPKKKIKVKPRKVKAPKKKVIKPKPAKKISQNEKARKLQILKDIKRMH